MAKKIMTVSELAQHLSVHRITIYRLLKGGTLPGFKIGRVWRFDLDDIANWMATGKAAQELIASDGHVSADGVQAEHDGVAKIARAVAKPANRSRVSRETSRANPNRR
jgi:excisionase family DNA binding protein